MTAITARPTLQKKVPRIDDAVQSHYRTLWMNIESAAMADRVCLQTLGLTSSQRGEGVSTAALYLAIAASQASARRVLLVDADLNNPTVHRVFGIGPGLGLAEALCGASESPKPLPTSLGNLFVVAAGQANGNPSRAHDPAVLGAVVKELAADFDLVVFDMPPANEASFTLRLAGLLDGVLLVVEAERVAADAARRATELLQRAETRLLGAVLNKRRGRTPTADNLNA